MKRIILLLLLSGFFIGFGCVTNEKYQTVVTPTTTQALLPAPQNESSYSHDSSGTMDNSVDKMIDGFNKIRETPNNSDFLDESEQVKIASSFLEKFTHYNIKVTTETPVIKGGVILFKSRSGMGEENFGHYDNLERFVPDKLRARTSDNNITVLLYAAKSCQYSGSYSPKSVHPPGSYYLGYSPGASYPGYRCSVMIRGFYWPENKIAGTWELTTMPTSNEDINNLVNGAFEGDEMLTAWLNNSHIEE